MEGMVAKAAVARTADQNEMSGARMLIAIVASTVLTANTISLSANLYSYSFTSSLMDCAKFFPG